MVKPAVQSLFGWCMVSVEEEEVGREWCVFCVWELIVGEAESFANKFAGVGFPGLGVNGSWTEDEDGL
jgi:hypothetical protein